MRRYSKNPSCICIVIIWTVITYVERPFGGAAKFKALAEKKEELLAAARHGAVLVSPCISPGEKEIAAAAFAEGLPLVAILENGFAPLYKPSGKRFDACAAGLLLLLAPWPHHTDRRPISRAQCLALNRLAEEVCLRAGRLRAEARSTGPYSPLEP